MNVESQGYVYEKNEICKGCLLGGKVGFSPQRIKSAPLTTVTKVSIAGLMAHNSAFIFSEITDGYVR